MKTPILKYGLLGWALVFFGCIGLERAYDECVSSGRCHASDAGETDAGEADAGIADAGRTDAGTSSNDGGAPDAGPGQNDAGLTDSGTGAQDSGTADVGPGPDAGGSPDTGTVPYDGGARCASSTHPRLRCDAPIDLGTGSQIKGSAMAATTDGFIAAWVGTTAEVREVHLDGSVKKLVTGVPVNAAQIAVDAKGSRWAAAWSDGNATAATCITSASDAGVQVPVNDGGAIEVLNIATSATGAIGLTAMTSGRFMGAHSTAGCPTELQQLRSEHINSGGVVSTSAPGGDGFRYVWTDQINYYNGSISMMSQPDGGTTYLPLSLSAPDGVAVVASTSGATVLTAFSRVSPGSGGTDVFDLGLYGTSSDLSGDGASGTASSVDPGWWSMGTCEAGCVVVGVIAREQVGPAVISFFSDDPEIRPRGTWDAVCSLQGQIYSGSSISVASFGGRLGVLLTTAPSAKLYLCDMPPLP